MFWFWLTIAKKFVGKILSIFRLWQCQALKKHDRFLSS